MEPKPHTLKSCQKSEANFWVKVNKQKKCWNWMASKNAGGYGFFWPVGSKRWIGAHRYSYFLAHGQFDQTKMVCHHCDNPSCVNPKHLFLGSNSDNLKDASEKGRLKPQFTKPIFCREGKHKMELDAIRIDSQGKRRCRWCQNEKTMLRYLRNRNKINAKRRKLYRERNPTLKSS